LNGSLNLLINSRIEKYADVAFYSHSSLKPFQNFNMDSKLWHEMILNNVPWNQTISQCMVLLTSLRYMWSWLLKVGWLNQSINDYLYWVMLFHLICSRFYDGMRKVEGVLLILVHYFYLLAYKALGYNSSHIFLNSTPLIIVF